jgi:hypothetical protein
MFHDLLAAPRRTITTIMVIVCRGLPANSQIGTEPKAARR